LCTLYITSCWYVRVQAHAIGERVHDINLSNLATETIVKVIIILQVSDTVCFLQICMHIVNCQCWSSAHSH